MNFSRDKRLIERGTKVTVGLHRKTMLPLWWRGCGMRNFIDICKHLQFKQWWLFTTKQTLWEDFLRAKYFIRSKPLSKKWNNGESLTWKNMLMNRQKFEQHIHWKLKDGNCSFVWDNWLGTGPLAQYTTNSNRFNNFIVSEFWDDGKWSLSKLIEQAPASKFSNILATEISPQHHLLYQAVWKHKNHGSFSCSAA